MKALFICNDKEEWNLLRKIFKNHFSDIELICAIRGEDALEYISFEGPFSIILIDAGLKNESPTKIAEDIVDRSGDRPIIFIGEEHVLKNRINDDFYVNSETADIFIKPYDIPRLKETLGKSLQWVKKEEFEQSIIEVNEEDFIPMRLRNFYLFKKIPFDAFIELTKTKYIKLLSKDKPYTHAQISALAKRKIKYLYLHKDQHLKFLESSVEKIKENLDQNTSSQKIFQTQIAGALVIHQYLRDVGITDSVIELTNKVLESAGKTYENFFTKDFTQLLKIFPLENGDAAERSLFIFYFCQSLSKGMGWGSGISKKKFGLTSILHDCFLENDEMIRLGSFDHPDMDFYNESEIQNYKIHMQRAKDMAKNFTGYSDTEFLIGQHHELPEGNGFPEGLSAGRLTTISCIFIIAHNVVAYLAINGLTRQNLNKCLNEMKGPYNQGSFKEPFNKLIKVLKP